MDTPTTITFTLAIIATLFVVGGFILASIKHRQDNRPRGATYKVPDKPDTTPKIPKNPDKTPIPPQAEGNGTGQALKLVPIAGSKYAELKDDVPPGMDWEEPLPPDNVIYGKFKRPDEPCLKYSLAVRIPLYGFLQIVWCWLTGKRHLHVESYYTVNGDPITASMNMAADTFNDERFLPRNGVRDE